MVQDRVVKEIPATAVEVKVTNLATPSFIKIYDKEDYTKRLNEVTEKLRRQMKKRKLKEFDSKTEPCTGDPVIIHNTLETNCELSSWWARGLLGNYSKETLKFDVFLVDHGYTINVARSDFTVIPKNLIPNEHLTHTVGIYNLIPAVPKAETSGHGDYCGLSRKWSDVAIKIARDFIVASNATYFDYQAIDENGIEYGELYLDVEKEIVSLSEILVSKQLAIHLTKEVSRLMKKHNYDILKKVNKVEGGIVARISAKSLESPRKHRFIVKERNGEGNESETRENFDGIERSKRRTATSKGVKMIRYSGEDCQQILVYSRVHCERLIMMADARFPVYIHEALKKQSIIALRRIQSYICPAVGKGLNVLAVGPPKCGKTLGYLMPILSTIATRSEMPEGNRPVALILCSSTSNVFNVTGLCSELLECYTDIRCVAGFNGRPNRSLVAEIYNGCQILVATPPFLLRFINQNDEHRKVINFENLAHLVIDGIDVILDKYYESFQQLYVKHIFKVRAETCHNLDKPPLQIIAVSGHWSLLLNEFAKRCMSDAYVCIGSYMEAAIYGRIKPKLYIVHSTKKMQRVKDLLSEETSMIKTVIICQDSNEARTLNEFLSPSQKTLIACESMIFTDIHGISECWKATVSGLYPILICTDEVLVDLNITDVDWLIHYSVTLRSKTQFYFRFSMLMENLKKGDGKSRVTIIADETNDVQLFGLVAVLERCGMKLPGGFMLNVARIAATLDSQKKMYPICNNVKAFGSCPRKNACPYRHCALAGVDTPVTPIKIGDSVKIIVTFVHNATHFTARVIEYISPYKEVTKYSAKEYTRLTGMIHTYYADKRNRRCLKRINVGDICALEATLDDFQRVKVLNVAERDCEDAPRFVDVKCVDTGAVLQRISVLRLMEIPEDLANRDTHIVEVFLAGLAPYDDEYEWNVRAVDDAHQWIADNTQPHSYVLGKVCLHIADTLWVDPLEIRTKIIGHPDIVSGSLKSHMIRLKHAVPSKKHLPQLYELCEIGMVRNADGESVVPASPINGSENDQSDAISS